MTRSELLALIANGENSGVEFKRDDLRPEQLAKEVVALANFQGGRILLGVDDDGSITGVRRDELEHWVMDTVFGCTVHPISGSAVSLGSPRVNNRPGSMRSAACCTWSSSRYPVAVCMISAETGSRTIWRRSSGTISSQIDEVVWGERLCSLGSMVEREDGPAVCTIVGLVLFDGPLAALRMQAAGGGREIAGNGVIEGLVEAMRPFVSEEAAEVGASMRRERLMYQHPSAMEPLLHPSGRYRAKAGSTSKSRRMRIWKSGLCTNRSSKSVMPSSCAGSTTGSTSVCRGSCARSKTRRQGIGTEVLPGQLRQQDVRVGRHIPPRYIVLDRFLKRPVAPAGCPGRSPHPSAVHRPRPVFEAIRPGLCSREASRSRQTDRCRSQPSQVGMDPSLSR